jgi:molybdenum cofactor synthesis domain-containing protein
MDGYALKAFDTRGASESNPVRLKLVGVQNTGDYLSLEIQKGECIQIATGSPLPDSADAVIMVENTSLKDDFVEIYREVSVGRNVAPEGEDMKKGDLVISKGSTLNPGRIGALAALGYVKVSVYSKPRVAIFSSGPEIIPQGEPLKPGKIYDINSFTLSAIIKMNGGIPVSRGIMNDDIDSIEKSLLDASKYDIGVFSGGSSVGEKDLFGVVMEKIGKVYFHGVSVKPGKPTLFGEVNKTPIFGMPGYPTSCLNNSYVFLTPTLRKIAGLEPKEYIVKDLPLGEKLSTKSDREQYITVKIKHGKAYRAYKASGDITSMSNADGFIILPSGISVLDEGELVSVTYLNLP